MAGHYILCMYQVIATVHLQHMLTMLTLKDIRAVRVYRVRSSWIQGITHTMKLLSRKVRAPYLRMYVARTRTEQK